jgi:hypothetical protein
MPADFSVGPVTIGPGNPAASFSFGWGGTTRGPVLCMFSPDTQFGWADHKMWITDYAQGREAGGPTYYSGLVSNNFSQAVNARLHGVYFPEFQADWNV